MGKGGNSLGVKWPERESEQLPITMLMLRKRESIPPFPHTSSYHSGYMDKQKDNFTFVPVV
jgi:hypothetical protein